MITGFKKKNSKNVIINILMILVFVGWLLLPPRNKIAQFCFTVNNVKLFFAEVTDKAEKTEYLFHRNNAVYLAQMGRKNDALKEIDEAVTTVPDNISETDLVDLHYDRAQIRLFCGNYQGALDDYLKVKNLTFVDNLKIALLYKETGNNKKAVSYCNNILKVDGNAYAGFACMADIYAHAGKPKVSVKLFDLLIDRIPNKSKYYLDRASYKKLCGDTKGANEDIEKAKELASVLDDSNIIEEAIHPKLLALTIK